jgi:hypothetical protein
MFTAIVRDKQIVQESLSPRKKNDRRSFVNSAAN